MSESTPRCSLPHSRAARRGNGSAYSARVRELTVAGTGRRPGGQSWRMIRSRIREGDVRVCFAVSSCIARSLIRQVVIGRLTTAFPRRGLILACWFRPVCGLRSSRRGGCVSWLGFREAVIATCGVVRLSSLRHSCVLRSSQQALRFAARSVAAPPRGRRVVEPRRDMRCLPPRCCVIRACSFRPEFIEAVCFAGPSSRYSVAAPPRACRVVEPIIATWRGSPPPTTRRGSSRAVIRLGLRCDRSADA